MNVKFISKVPEQDGYFLMKFNDQGGVHLVLIQTEFDGQRVIIPETFTKKQISIRINEAHKQMLSDALFSETPFKFIFK